jgi:hypothetical protein
MVVGSGVRGVVGSWGREFVAKLVRFMLNNSA